MKHILFIAACFIATTTFAQTTNGDIIGTFKDAEGKEGLFGAQVYTTRGEAVYRAVTDVDGRFRISAIPAGVYDLVFIFEEDTTKAPSPVEVLPDGIGDAGTINQGATTLDVVEITGPIYRLGKGVAPEIKLGAKDIKHLPGKFSAADMISTMTSDVRKTDDGNLVFRGARKGDFGTYIDGVKVRELENLPSAGIGYVMVYSGAIPAKYGDTTGGIVVMETLSYFDLLREWEAKQ